MVGNVVHILIGEEDLLKEIALSKIRKKYLGSENLPFNYLVLDGKSTTSSQIINECQQLPFMADTRLVVVKDADSIIDEKLIEYIQAPVETTCLVLLVHKIDKRLGIYRVLEKYTQIEEFDYLDKKGIIEWIQNYIRTNKKHISAIDAGYITDIMENNLTGIKHELDKLITYIDQRENITRNDIETMVSKNRLKDSFALTEAIQNKDTSGAIKLINELLEQGNSIQQIIGAIRWALTRLWQIKEGDISDIPQYFLNKLINQAKGFTKEELKRGLVSLLALEKLMRTYTLPEYLLLELVAIQLIENTPAFLDT